MADREAARRLKAKLLFGIAAAGLDADHPWSHLAQLSGVSQDTIENSIYGRSAPHQETLRKLAGPLEPFVRFRDLEAAYWNLPPEEPPLVEVLQQIAPDLRELILLLRESAGEAVLEAVRDGLAGRRRGGAPPPLGLPDRPSDRTET